MSLHVVSVRALCEFAARHGDLEIRFTAGPSAQQGVVAHGVVAARRGVGYLRELPLEAEFSDMRVRGRADGYDPATNRLEEFKSHRGSLERMAANKRDLHWAQLRVYGAMLCRQRGLDSVDLALVYFEISSEIETVLEERTSASELARYVDTLCARYVEWAEQRAADRAARDRFLEALPFPHEGLRAGQRELARAVYRAALRGESLMAEAPTGIGKTLGTLFPMLKAMPRRQLDKIFFLVAKTSAREAVLQALRMLRSAGREGVAGRSGVTGCDGAAAQAGSAAMGMPLRVVELTAKESACVHPGRECQARSCPLARGFFDRLPAARLAALRHDVMDARTLRDVAAAHAVCPYHLAQELLRWCDVVIGDFNYYFDHNAILHAFRAEQEWRVALLVDEVHNLVARARDMYSTRLAPEMLAAARRHAPRSLAASLRAVGREWAAVHRVQTQVYEARDGIPEAFTSVLQRAVVAITEQLADSSGELDPALLDFYFEALRFCRLSTTFGCHSLFDVTLEGESASLCIRNIDPGPFLSTRFAGSVTSILFSATLSPACFYRKLLGLPAEVSWLAVESPFEPRQLIVRVSRRISTRYRDRESSLAPIAALMACQYRDHPGNYLAFFGSFDYLDRARASFEQRHPTIPVWSQTRAMRAAERETFLQRFVVGGRGIGFAVLGGAFAEGVDLPGERLIGTFIATLGMPPLNAVNAQIERRMHGLFDAGFEFTYLYPGLQKVVQAAGRVIRTPQDRGFVHLLDDRFQQAGVRALLPRWWTVECA